jgi:hypothetical protein
LSALIIKKQAAEVLKKKLTFLETISIDIGTEMATARTENGATRTPQAPFCSIRFVSPLFRSRVKIQVPGDPPFFVHLFLRKDGFMPSPVYYMYKNAYHYEYLLIL